MKLLQPANTVKYDVKGSDTLSSIALRYNTTPSELSRLNRLSSVLLYPGQTLFVPDKPDEIKEKENEVKVRIADTGHPNAPITIKQQSPTVPPSYRTMSPTNLSLSPDHSLEGLLNRQNSEEEVSRRYLKIKSKYITDGQGVISGVLLVTPQTIMFNPSVSDHLVIDRGRDYYVVRLPLKALSMVSLYEDIAAMVTGDQSQQYIPTTSRNDEAFSPPKPGVIVCQETGEEYTIKTPKNDVTAKLANNNDGTATAGAGDLNTVKAQIESLSIDELTTLTSNSKLKNSTVNDIVNSTSENNIERYIPSGLNDTEPSSVQNTDNDIAAVPEVPCSSSTKEENVDKEQKLKQTENPDCKLNDMVCNSSSSADQGVGDSIQEDVSTNAVPNSSKADQIYSADPLAETREGPATNPAKTIDSKTIEGLATIPVNADAIKSPGVVTTSANIDAIHSPDMATLTSDHHHHHCSSDNKDNSFFASDEHASSTPKHTPCMSATHKTVAAGGGGREPGKPLPSDSIMNLNSKNIKGPEASSQPLSKNPHNNHLLPLAPLFDSSKDSGFSEMTRSQQSMDEGDLHIQTLANADRTPLSDEAKKWLGNHGVASSLSTASSPMSPPMSPSSDREVTSPDIVPSPASEFRDPLMYVAININKRYWCPAIAKQNAIMGIPPNRDQKRRQHWFAVPRERIDQFYGFVLHWLPDLHSRVSTPSSPDEINEPEEGLHIVDDTFANSPASTFGWEKLHSEDASGMHKLRVGSIASSKTSLKSFGDDEPEMSTESSLLAKEQLKQLTRKLPSRTVGRYMELIYSTMEHGISLNTLYRNFASFDCPVLLIITDQNSRKFGAFLSDPPMISEGFYGTGECMLFTFVDDKTLGVYNWTGENSFFIKGSKTSLSIGGGEGVLALWLDEDLYHGRSHSCRTFNNDTLSASEDFICAHVEAWGFV